MSNDIIWDQGGPQYWQPIKKTATEVVVDVISLCINGLPGQGISVFSIVQWMLISSFEFRRAQCYAHNCHITHSPQYFHPFPYHYTMSDIQPYLYQSSPLSMDNQPHIQAHSAKRLLAEPGYLRRVIQDPRHQSSPLRVCIQPYRGGNTINYPLPSTYPHGLAIHTVLKLLGH